MGIISLDQLKEQKVKSLEELVDIRSQRENEIMVLASGCFDLIHSDHFEYLAWAKNLAWAKKLGGYLVVAINDDESVKKLKGPDRPIIKIENRIIPLVANFYVDYIIRFNESDVVEIINRLEPNIFARGKDSALEIMNQEEREIVEEYNGKIFFFNKEPQISTTELVQRIKESNTDKRYDLALKKKGFEGIISRVLNRKISAPIAKLLYEKNQNLNPNTMTYLFTGIGVTGGLAFIFNDPMFAVAGGLLAQASSVLDGVDGDYARYMPNRTPREKEYGGKIDTICDRVVDGTVIAGMGCYAYENLGELGIIIGGSALALSYTTTYSRHYIKNKIKDIKEFFTGLDYLGGRDVRLLTLCLGGVGEGLSYIYPELRGTSVAISLAVVSAFSLTTIVDRFYKLKNYINN